MSEKNEMTVTKFLNSLDCVEYFIKRNGRHYELRENSGPKLNLFTDRDGELFGIKNSKIYFYVFEKGTNKPAEWVSKHLRHIYIEWDLQSPEAEKFLEEDGCISWNYRLSYAFILYLLEKENLLITDIDGRQVKIPPASRIY